MQTAYVFIVRSVHILPFCTETRQREVNIIMLPSNVLMSSSRPIILILSSSVCLRSPPFWFSAICNSSPLSLRSLSSSVCIRRISSMAPVWAHKKTIDIYNLLIARNSYYITFYSIPTITKANKINSTFKTNIIYFTSKTLANLGRAYWIKNDKRSSAKRQKSVMESTMAKNGHFSSDNCLLTFTSLPSYFKFSSELFSSDR